MVAGARESGTGASAILIVEIVMVDIRSIVHSDPQIMGGEPVFVGTRVPVQNLLDYLEGGDSLDEFLEDFPSVKREQAVAALEYAGHILINHASAA